MVVFHGDESHGRKYMKENKSHMIPVYISSHFWWSQTAGRQPWEMALLLGRYQVHRHILLPRLLVHVQVAKGNEEVQEVRQK